jgi:hypothetical protein
MSFLDDARKGLLDVGEVLDGAERPPFEPAVVPVDYENAEDFRKAKGEAGNTPAPGGGMLSLQLGRVIELVHFGKVHRDRDSSFAHPPYDQLAADALDSVSGGHGGMYRAALLRECMLCRSFAESASTAIVLFGSASPSVMSPTAGLTGGLGTIINMVGDLLGGASSSLGAAAGIDVEPFLNELTSIQDQIVGPQARYKELHAAGLALHEWRGSFRKYISDEYSKLRDGAKRSGPGGLLGSLPLLGGMMPAGLGDFFQWVQRLAFLATDVILEIHLGLLLFMMPTIEEACRQMSVHAIVNRRAPVFPVWAVVEKSKGDMTLVETPSGMPTSGPLGGIGNALNSAATKVNDTATDVRDFFDGPPAQGPAKIHLDKVFKLDADNIFAPYKANAFSELAVQTCMRAIGAKAVPESVQKLIAKITAVNVEFARGVYASLLSWDHQQEIKAEHLVVAARTHMVDQLVEMLFELFDFLDQWRGQPLFNLGLGKKSLPVGVDGLIQRAKDLLSSDVASHLDPSLDFALHQVHKQLEAVRLGATSRGKTPSMEAYLGALPSILSTLFCHTFFPLWDMVAQAVMAPVVQALAPAAEGLVGGVNSVQDTLRDVRAGIAKAQKVAEVLQQGLAISKSGFENLEKQVAGVVVAGDLNDPNSGLDAADTIRDMVEALAISDSEWQEVVLSHRWKEAPAEPTGDDEQSSDTSGAKGSAAAAEVTT